MKNYENKKMMNQQKSGRIVLLKSQIFICLLKRVVFCFFCIFRCSILLHSSFFPTSFSRKKASHTPGIFFPAAAFFSCFSFGNSVSRNAALSGTFEPRNAIRSLVCMFYTHSWRNAFSPAFKTWGRKFPPHQFLYFSLRQFKLNFYGIKRRSVFPSHLNDSVNINECENLHRLDIIGEN